MTKPLLSIFLLLSLALNALLAFPWVFSSQAMANDQGHMTCEQATSEILNKTATFEFAERNDFSLEHTHAFLRASDYNLRNVFERSGEVTFVYTAIEYFQTCGPNVRGIDGSIVRIGVGLTSLPKIVRIY